MLSGENWCWSRLVTRWILKSLTTTETRSRGTQRVIEKKVAINSKTFQVSAQLFESGSASRLSTSFSSFHHPSRSVGHASRVPLSACVPNRDEWGRDRNQRQTQCSSGSRGGGRASPIFLDQNEARREVPPPSLMWWSGSATAMPYVVWVLFPFSARTKRVGFLRELWCFPFHKIGHVQFLIVGRGWRWLDFYRVCKGNTHPLLRACVLEIFPFAFAL